MESALPPPFYRHGAQTIGATGHGCRRVQVLNLKHTRGRTGLGRRPLQRVTDRLGGHTHLVVMICARHIPAGMFFAGHHPRGLRLRQPGPRILIPMPCQRHVTVSRSNKLSPSIACTSGSAWGRFVRVRSRASAFILYNVVVG